LSSVKVFFPPLFVFFLSVLLSFLLLSNWFFYRPSFPPLFFDSLIPVSLTHVVSSLAYPNLLGTKMLGCCCCCSDGGYFNAIMTFPQNYPNSPPSVRFTSEMWHPNGKFFPSCDHMSGFLLSVLIILIMLMNSQFILMDVCAFLSFIHLVKIPMVMSLQVNGGHQCTR
jgi:hypothetical protein